MDHLFRSIYNFKFDSNVDFTPLPLFCDLKFLLACIGFHPLSANGIIFHLKLVQTENVETNEHTGTFR